MINIALVIDGKFLSYTADTTLEYFQEYYENNEYINFVDIPSGVHVYLPKSYLMEVTELDEEKNK